jgi:hypothetical protein
MRFAACWVLAVVCACSGGGMGSGPDAGPPIPDGAINCVWGGGGVTATNGAACPEVARCVTGELGCAHYQVCDCDGHTFACSSPRTITANGSCTELTEGFFCQVEGEAACDADGTISGGCNCRGGVWQCFSSCSDGCPSGPLSQPAEGDPCTIPSSTTMCRYQAAVCTCATGRFHCEAT